MRRLCLLVVIFSFYGPNTVLSQQAGSAQRNVTQRESKFIAEFNMEYYFTDLIRSRTGEDVGVLEQSDEKYRDLNGNTILYRRFDLDIWGFRSTANLNLLEIIRGEIQKKLRESRMQYKESANFKEGFSFQYSSGCNVGSVDVRGLLGEDKHFHLFFIFNESYCKRKIR